jgi:flavocytochrome c
MKETGLPLKVISQLGGHSRPRTHRAPDLADGTPVPIGWSIMNRLSQKILTEFKGRITVMTNTSAIQLLHTTTNEYDGSIRIRVRGVRYSNLATNTEAELTADSVILTTGGFANDHTSNSLLKEFAPELEQTPTTNGDFATGDGVKMARELGAALMDMDKIQLHPTGLVDPKRPDARTKYLGPEALRGSGGILINRKGKRFTNELGLRSVVSQAIMDQNDVYPGSGGSKYACCVLNKQAVDLFGPAQLGFYKDKQGLFKDAEDVKALAAVVGCDEETLTATLSGYGAAARKGRCTETNKTVFPAIIDTQGPFVVAFVTPSIHYTMGGVCISPAAEVQVVDPGRVHGALFGMRRPVLGLFGAGEVTAGVHGANRLGGNSLLECVVFGRIAGDRAATIIQRSDSVLSDGVWTPVVLREVREGTGFGRGSVVLRFNLPGALQVTGLKLGQFVAIRGEWDGQQLVGYYSPITLPNERGVIGLLARKDKGSLREWITALRPGDAVFMKACPGIAIDRIPEKSQLMFEGYEIRRFGFIAGGTGIAPMLQIIRAATKKPYNEKITEMRLIYAAETEEELTYERAMLEFETSSRGTFKCNYVLNDPPPGWKHGVGFVDAAMLRQFMPQPGNDLLLLICGPPVMQTIVARTLVKLGHNPQLVRTVDDVKPAIAAPTPAKM